MPPTAVQMRTLELRPVEQSTEFVGVVKSRQSISVQTQAEGFITRIAVRSGSRVAAGALLMSIDSRTEDAAVTSLKSVAAQREIDVAYARQEFERQQKLLAAGAASQMDADRAANTLRAAEAQQRTVEEQIRQLETDLTYYQVVAPSAGVIGDIPVHEGDRVTKSTVLTTIDANAGLELYLSIPVQQAPRLKPGLPVRVLDDRGAALGSYSVGFIAPSVEPSTQTVLAKVPIRASEGLRTDQYVRAQVIWSLEPALTVPVTSVVRINGQFFVFVAEEANGGLVARQRAVSLGPLVGSEYALLGGVKAGEQLIVSGVQKVGDNAPVRPETAPPPAAPAASAGQGGQ